MLRRLLVYSSSKRDKCNDREPTTGMVFFSSSLKALNFSKRRRSARSSSVSASPVWGFTNLVSAATAAMAPSAPPVAAAFILFLPFPAAPKTMSAASIVSTPKRYPSSTMTSAMRCKYIAQDLQVEVSIKSSIPCCNPNCALMTYMRIGTSMWGPNLVERRKRPSNSRNKLRGSVPRRPRWEAISLTFRLRTAAVNPSSGRIDLGARIAS
mmetsp:Transcript_118559/g.177189  ORF Transcript_118559/g.177189 Transcript_118559/m.177189 type:complete len:210 (-) Transcript_118559:693-1322(-)